MKTLIAIIIVAMMGVGAMVAINANAQEGLISNENDLSLDIVTQKFINEIKVLNSVKLNISIFDNESFDSLEDRSRPIPEEEKGRANPFAPIGS